MKQKLRSLYIRLRVWLERNPWQSALPYQMPPSGAWRLWLFIGGAGAGKTWAGMRWVIERAKHGRGPILIIGQDNSYFRFLVDEMIVASPRWFKPTYHPAKRQLRWPNGVVAVLTGASWQLPSSGFQTIWYENLSLWQENQAEKFRRAQASEAILGDVRSLITTRPPWPITSAKMFVESLLKLEGPEIRVSRASTFDNPHLPLQWVEAVREKYSGTTIGQSTLQGELLDPEQKP